MPVKITQPRTALMYITSDREHLIELKEAIHVKEVAEAAPLGHGVIARHKHGHSLGGLPTLFWLAIGLLVVLFHLFLCKLICSEFCGPNSPFRAEQHSASGVAAYKSILRSHIPDLYSQKHHKESTA